MLEFPASLRSTCCSHLELAFQVIVLFQPVIWPALLQVAMLLEHPGLVKSVHRLRNFAFVRVGLFVPHLLAAGLALLLNLKTISDP